MTPAEVDIVPVSDGPEGRSVEIKVRSRPVVVTVETRDQSLTRESKVEVRFEVKVLGQAPFDIQVRGPKSEVEVVPEIRGRRSRSSPTGRKPILSERK
jgi:hypothetical protein